jgi:hypothetical protein
MASLAMISVGWVGGVSAVGVGRSPAIGSPLPGVQAASKVNSTPKIIKRRYMFYFLLRIFANYKICQLLAALMAHNTFKLIELMNARQLLGIRLDNDEAKNT